MNVTLTLPDVAISNIREGSGVRVILARRNRSIKSGEVSGKGEVEISESQADFIVDGVK
jgi:hypothetical protein